MGQFDIRIDTAGTLERLRAQMQAMPAGVERARRRALTRIKNSVQRKVLQAASQATGAPQKTLKKLLRYTSKRTADGGIAIWVGTNPIKVHHLGRVRWSRRMQGARVGRTSYPGSWWHGRGAVMERLGRHRMPIRAVTVEVHEAVTARIKALEPSIASEFERVLAQQLNFALFHEGGVA